MIVLLQCGEFIFNGRSSLDFNLKMETYPSIPHANEEFEEIETGNRNGNYILNKRTYPNKKIAFVVTKNSTNDLLISIDEIINWLINVNDERLLWGREDRCYRVKKVIIGDFQQEFETRGSFEVTFICEPFLSDFNYKKVDVVTPDNFTAKTIFVEGTYGALTRFRISGTDGYCRIKINGESCYLNNLNKDKPVIVDSKLLVAYEEQTKIFKNCSNFINLKNGKNEIIIDAVSRPNVTLEYLNLYY